MSTNTAKKLPAPQGAEVVKLREADGWRAGKPVEDPEKLKRWGYITAKPSEYLVHVRRGKVLLSSSGQGATCFKWPNDAVSIVPTSLQQLQFTADQVTSEKVGIEVVGLAVYRIAEPLLAYRVLNFSYPERAQEKLEETLTSMFIGATRRLIANLSIDDCLQKRKTALASELLQEIAPVVGGFGRPDDTTDKGWGVVIDTIEIQEVRVLSEKVFAAMQAPYRTSLERRAREAKALADTEVAEREAECNRKIAEAKTRSEAAIREGRAETEKRAAELEAKGKLLELQLRGEQREAELQAKLSLDRASLASEAELRAERAAMERRDAEEAAKLAVRKIELSVVEARSALEAFETESVARAKRAELDRADAEAVAILRRLEVELGLAEGHARAEVELELAKVMLSRAEADARRIGAEKLPELAKALGRRIGEVKIAQYGGGENPFELLTRSVTAILDLAKRT